VGDETVDLGVSDELLQKGIRKSRPAGSADEGVGEMVMFATGLRLSAAVAKAQGQVGLARLGS